jgi:hypothetical protein
VITKNPAYPPFSGLDCRYITGTSLDFKVDQLIVVESLYPYS